MTDDGIFVEKCCSRCDRISWDSLTGFYDERCTIMGPGGEQLLCNVLGRRMETDAEGNVRTFDANGNEITSAEHLRKRNEGEK